MELSLIRLGTLEVALGRYKDAFQKTRSSIAVTSFTFRAPASKRIFTDGSEKILCRMTD